MCPAEDSNKKMSLRIDSHGMAAHGGIDDRGCSVLDGTGSMLSTIGMLGEQHFTHVVAGSQVSLAGWEGQVDIQ